MGEFGEEASIVEAAAARCCEATYSVPSGAIKSGSEWCDDDDEAELRRIDADALDWELDEEAPPDVRAEDDEAEDEDDAEGKSDELCGDLLSE